MQLLCKVLKPEPPEEELQWTVAKVRCLMGQFCLGDVVRISGMLEQPRDAAQASFPCLLLSPTEEGCRVLQQWQSSNPGELSQARPLGIVRDWQPTLHVTNLPPLVAADNIQAAFEQIAPVTYVSTFFESPVPHAFVTFSEGGEELVDRIVQEVTDGQRQILILGEQCALKRRKATKTARKAQIATVNEAKAAAKERRRAAQGAWRPEMFARFPRLQSSMDQHVFVDDLSADLKQLLGHYFAQAFANKDGDKAVDCLWSVAAAHPSSLRVKELFETVEAYRQIVTEILYINSQSRKRRKRQKIATEGEAAAAECVQGSCVEHIFDMACGHGLLGVLLAHRFPELHVLCDDVERRRCFDHYVDAFRSLKSSAFRRGFHGHRLLATVTRPYLIVLFCSASAGKQLFGERECL